MAASKLRFLKEAFVRYCPWERSSTSAREFLHFCQLNKAVQKLEDCSVKAELIRSDFTPSARIEYVDGQREVLDQLPPRMVDHVLSQCRLVSQGKRIWEWDGPDHYYWDDYDYDEDDLSDGLGEGGPSSYAHSFDKELLDLVVMDDDFGEDDEGGEWAADDEDEDDEEEDGGVVR